MASRDSVVETLRYAWDEGLARRVLVTRGERSALDLPLAVVVVLAVLLSPVVAIGGVAALAMGYRIEVHRAEAPAPAADGLAAAEGGEAVQPEEDLPLADAVHGDEPGPPGTASPERPA